MRAFHLDKDEQVNSEQAGGSVLSLTPRLRKPLPPAGKPLSFEEAKAKLFVKHEEALRKLAK